jgi:hypothetical protein
MDWFPFLFRITNANNKTPDVGGSLLPCFSGQALIMRLLVPSAVMIFFSLTK